MSDQCADQPEFEAFVATIKTLRSPGGCPWDREQTHESIAHNLIEEAYETVETIEEGDVAHLREELGDVLLQVVLQAQIAADAGEFTINDVCRDVNDKMIRRHPHVFTTTQQADSANEVLDIWDSVKLSEKEQAEADQDKPKGLLDGVPKGLPALMQAQKISRKAVSAGFEWDTLDDVWDQVDEERAELQQAYESGDASAVEEELGDVLFSLVNVARKMHVDSETALRATCNKFRDRWSYMEEVAWNDGKRIEDLSMDELQALWDQAKQRGNHA